MNFVITREDMEVKVNRVLRYSGDLYNFDDVMKAIGTGDMQSFTEGDTWIVTQVIVFPRRKVLRVMLVVGYLTDAKKSLVQLEEFAKSVGATRIEATGRDGWWQFAEPGWKRTGSAYAKDL